ncbi:hypothetical protein R3P38DRAFT_3308804 [Favolaschia claudopus]|uniref:Uncharacterized protein n=1 Tax=Favolaschia claudopus TaxID=2862362 RepID=A0AAW0D2J3_9AGAR
MFVVSCKLVRLAILAVTALNALRAVLQWSRIRALDHPSSQLQGHTYIGVDFPRELPFYVGHAAMWFNHTERYGLGAYEDWKSVLPGGNGWVKLGPESRPFAVSMYHQLHCVIGIRSALYRASINDTEETLVSLGHINHCFNYLRQLLLCRADTTLEPTTVVKFPDGRVGASALGEGVNHVCRDWTQVRRFVEDNWKGWPKEN